MAKSNAALKAVTPEINRDLLTQIAQNNVRFVSKAEGEAMLMHNPPLIEINMGAVDPNDSTKVACRVTPAGTAYLQSNESAQMTNLGFEIITNAVLPAVKRGGGGAGAPMKYPFDKMEVGNSFFVQATAKMPNPLKTLGSTITSANLRYATKIGTKTVERSKRGAKNKLVLDDNGHKIMEQKEVPIHEFTRKFTIRAVKAGVAYGDWTAPADGVLIARSQ